MRVTHLFASSAFLFLFSITPLLAVEHDHSHEEQSAAQVQGTGTSDFFQHGHLYKCPYTPTVYYYTNVNGNEKLYYFPNETVYFSWYSDFSHLETVSLERYKELEEIPSGGAIAMRGSTTLLKTVDSPKVYAVSRQKNLHWIQNEEVAKAYFGDSWNHMIWEVQTLDGYTAGKTISQTATIFEEDFESAVDPRVSFCGIHTWEQNYTDYGCGVDFPFTSAGYDGTRAISMHNATPALRADRQPYDEMLHIGTSELFEAGHRYRVSARVKYEGPQDAIDILFAETQASEDMHELEVRENAQTYSVTSNWSSVHVDFTAEENSTLATLFYGNVGEEGQFFIDDIHVVQMTE